MTRETKIGLLVGLAFIIVIGILLSDHMTSTTQPPLAMLDGAADNVNQSVTAPAPAQPAPASVTNVPKITPATPVLTQSELQPPPAPPVQPQPQPQPTAVTRVEIGGPGAGGASPRQPQGPIAIHQTDSPVVSNTPEVPIGTQEQHPQPPAQPTNPGPVVSNTNTGNTGTQIADAGEEDSAKDLAKWLQGAPAKSKPKPAAELAKREYIAQAGDSLSRIASRQLGKDTPANRDAIIAANPSLQKNPDLIIEGRTYLIPQAGESASTPTKAPADSASATAKGNAVPARAKIPAIPETEAVPPRNAKLPEIPETVAVKNHGKGKPTPVTELVDRLPSSTPADGGGSLYVVKENDNLWKIASEQLGNGNMWQQIRELNKDVLKGRDTVVINMRLRLPAKPVVSARAE
jgi:nucleoid-associated protein YgaU